MFGSIGKAVGGMFGGGQKPSGGYGKQQNFQMGPPQQGQSMGGPKPPMQPQGGIGPSIQSAGQMMNKFGMGGMKPPSMGQQYGEMGGMNSGMKPPMGGMGGFKPPWMRGPNPPTAISENGVYGGMNDGPGQKMYPGGSATFDEMGGRGYDRGPGGMTGKPEGGLSPSPNALPGMFDQMMQQKQQGQAPETMQPAPYWETQQQEPGGGYKSTPQMEQEMNRRYPPNNYGGVY